LTQVGFVSAAICPYLLMKCALKTIICGNSARTKRPIKNSVFNLTFLTGVLRIKLTKN